MVDKTVGLIPMQNTLRSHGLNQTTPATGPPGSASHIIFSEDNTKLIALSKVSHPPLVRIKDRTNKLFPKSLWLPGKPRLQTPRKTVPPT
jgi:hypothetical protein